MKYSNMENGGAMDASVPYVNIIKQKNVLSSIENEDDLIIYDEELENIISSISFYDEVSKQGVDYNEFNFLPY